MTNNTEKRRLSDLKMHESVQCMKLGCVIARVPGGYHYIYFEPQEETVDKIVAVVFTPLNNEANDTEI